MQLPGDGVTLSVLGNARAGAERLIFLHGFPESAECWRPQLDAFAPDYDVLAPDQRGYGASGRPVGVAEYRVERLCADILALAGDAARVTLIGHDWGGLAAWFCAAAHPGRIAQAIIVNAPHPTRFQQLLDTDAAQREASAYTRALIDPGFEAAVLADGGDAFWDALFGAHLAAGEIGAAARAAQLADWRVPGTLTSMTDWYRASPFRFPDAAPGSFAQVPFPALRIAVPVTIIWGEDDPVLLPQQLDGLAGLVPDLTIHRVAAAGHGILHQRPALVTSLIASALR